MLSFKEIAKLFEEIELRLIASLKRNLSGHKQWEKDEGFKWTAWQAEKLSSIEKFRKENLDIVSEYTDVIDNETRMLMQEQFDEGALLAEKKIKEAGEDLTEKIEDSVIIRKQPQPAFFEADSRKLGSLIQEITQLEKHAETAVLRMTDDVYRQTVHRVQLAMASGSMTLNQAIDISVKDFLDKGLNCIVYSDGRRVNIADYVRMALRTTSTRAQLQGQAQRAYEMGYDTVIVSQYSMCSETCLPWQGRVYIDDVFVLWDGQIQECVNGELWGKSHYCGKWFPLLSTAIHKGLFHPNCRHSVSVWIEGRMDPPETLDGEKIKERSALEQKQRALERKVRKYKRYVEGCSDPRNVKFYKEKLNEARTELSTLIKENSDILKYDKDRVKHYYGGTPKESLDNYNPRDIIEDEIRKGSVFLEINHEKQARHLLGDGYIEGRSYFTVSEDVLAQILKEKYGTGELKFDDKTGKWKRKEIIEVLYDIGICIDKNGNKELTNRITIHYSSTGVHLVPAKKVRKSND